MRAVKEQAEVSIYFETLTESCPQDLLPIWTEQIKTAEATRQVDVTSMDYMNPQVEKRGCLGVFCFRLIKPYSSHAS